MTNTRSKAPVTTQPDENQVEVQSLSPGQRFVLKNKTYTVSAVYPFAAMVVLENPGDAKPVERLPVDTVVTPVETQEETQEPETQEPVSEEDENA